MQMRCLLSLVPWIAAAHGALAEPVDFRRDIAPMLEQHCIRCHQPGIEKGDVSLATGDDLAANEYIVAGKPAESHLLDLVRASAEQEKPAMPKEGPPLSKQQVALLSDWITQGALWPKELVIRQKAKAGKSWWSLQPLAAAEPPASPNLPAAWKANPIDRFIYAKLLEKQLRPNAPASRRDLIRRVSFDLTGLPPTPEEVQAFVSDSSSDAAAYEKVVDRLLASDHYGEHWGRHWLDVVRFGESNGFERNVIINNLWPFRDYVIRSFNEDKPFDRLILEHLAGDVIGQGDPRVEIGTAFLVCGPYDNVGNQDAAQAAIIRANIIDEVIRATGESFLGLTVGCARCHDHKFDPVVQRDYYGMYATFAGVRHGERVAAMPARQQARAKTLKPLQASKARLEHQRLQLRQTIAARAKAASTKVAAGWKRPKIDRYGTEEVFSPVQARYVRLRVDGLDTNPNARTGFHIDEFEVWTAAKNNSDSKSQNVALASAGARAEGASRVAEDFTDAYSAKLTIDGKLGARWIAAGPELKITLAKTETVNRIFFSSDRKRSLDRRHSKTTFVGEYAIEVSADGKRWQEVASSRDRQPITPPHGQKRFFRAAVTRAEQAQLAQFEKQIADTNRNIAAVKPLPAWWMGQFTAAKGPFHVFVGGDPQRKGKQALPASLSVLGGSTSRFALPASAAESQRRLALAKWIASKDNPLTPRVLANRIWHYHFGTGIVDTPSDFGYMGGKPTHPELLDWLARKIISDGWRQKPLHKLIVTSQAYRQAGDHHAAAAELDADSRYLWRFPPRRLSGEEIRDTMLAVSGKLDTRAGGAGFRLYRYLQDNVATYVPLAKHGPETYRRAVYHQNARAAQVDVMSDFDCPDPAFAAPRRASTTTPLQALTLLNHSFTLDMSNFFAQRLARDAGDAPEQQVRRAFQLAFAREPATDELQAALALAKQHGWPALCRALLNANEFVYVN